MMVDSLANYIVYGLEGGIIISPFLMGKIYAQMVFKKF
ncbi:hypothetical protein bcere0013_28740 [Bacillus cereus BDRD-ST26]|uniref:Uncharacterized protein n=1 Tax=Bacillus cereus (strain AH187) TaxID=405534 RepID=B7HWP9_BACC7|nr:hypothetical protein BCAH187_A3178 [Bacillus cereus AH187]EEK99909.1 hypothetical protein bcere0013_28740 [Bacillus cereus BDRD-ST26]